ncbi:MAG: tetratricopeptide repeat protein [Litorilinea sp.]
MDAFAQFFDVTLLATIGLIFVATLFGAYLRSRQRDVCLKSFEGYKVTIERSGDKLIWGEMELEGTGLELHYTDSVQDTNHVVSSYVMYAAEYADIQAIYRYVDQLDEEGVKQRQKDLDRSFHPNIVHRSLRGVQHFFHLANESLSDVMSVIIGRLRKPAGRYISDTGEEHLRRFGTTVIGSVGGNYEGLLERLIGHKVIADILEGDEVHEHVGIFKNYSPDFIELLNVQFPERQSVALAAQCGVDAFVLSAQVEDGKIHVKNQTSQPILVQSLTTDDGEEEMLNVVVNSDESLELHPEKPFEKGSLNVRVVRELDMIVPRTRCVIRHRAERYKPEILPEIIFDLGFILTGSSVLDAREARLRRRIQETPDAALAMSNLGGILVQKKQFAEAETWLRRAYELRNSLPDNGKRTEMLLAELERKHKNTIANSQLISGQRESVAVPMLSANGSTNGTSAPQQGPYSGM